ncbi:stability/partitioning determinant (plasmid) [Pseudomonas fluorescens]|nr:stability/partitioning determinant [Pseudomonas fluorescens]
MSGDQAKEPTEAANAFAILADFKAKPSSVPVVTKEIEKDINLVAQDNGFHSREAKPVQPAKTKRFNAAEPKKQLNIKIPVPMHDRYYRMAEERGIKVLHQLLGDALDALEEKEKRAAGNKE